MLKKMGRPTDNPKRHEVKVRLDDETYGILADYCQRTNHSLSEGIRNGIRLLSANTDYPVLYATDYPTILLLGEPGCGKKCLLGKIFGQNILQSPPETSPLLSAYWGNISGLTVNVVTADTNWPSDTAIDHLHAILSTHAIQLIWYCLSITSERLEQKDLLILQALLSQEKWSPKRLGILFTKCDQDNHSGSKAWTLKNRLRHHFSAVLACLETSALDGFTLDLPTLHLLSLQALENAAWQKNFTAAWHFRNPKAGDN